MPDDDPPLGYWEGSPVLDASLAMRNAGDGLSKSMKIEKRAYRQGDVVYVVLECTVGPVQFKPMEGGVERKLDFIAGVATVVDRDLVIAQLDEQRRRNEAAEAEAEAERQRAKEEAKSKMVDGEEVELPIGAGGGLSIVKDLAADPLDALGDTPRDPDSPAGKVDAAAKRTRKAAQ